MIINTNRYGSINGKITFTANESYGLEDMGRVLIENEMNDMAIFNAVLKNDMYEIKARNEGTLLESELQTLSESSVKEFCRNIIEKLKKFWQKVKGIFTKAYATLSAYVVRNGKAFVAMHRKKLADVKPDAKVGHIWVANKDDFLSDIKAEKISSDIKGDIGRLGDKSKSSTDFAKEYLDSVITGFSGSGDSFYDFAKKHCFEEKTNATVADINIGGMMATLENGRKPIEGLKKTEKDLEKSVKEAIKELEAASKKASGDMKEQKDKDAESDKLRGMQNAANGMTSAISTVTRTSIRLVKFQLAQCRKALAAAVGNTARMESTLVESMIQEAAEETEMLDDDTVTELAPEEEELANAIVAAIDEKLDGSCDDEGDDE